MSVSINSKFEECHTQKSRHEDSCNRNDTQVPILFSKRDDCCGCTACYAVCPKRAISMIPDIKGFEYPKIDEKKCIRCEMCIKVCPIKKADKVIG